MLTILVLILALLVALKYDETTYHCELPKENRKGRR